MTFTVDLVWGCATDRGIMEAYLPILIQLILAVGIAVTIIVASHIFGQRARRGKIKDTAYECGMIADNNEGSRFSVKFYVTAMLFILFDIEIVFLVPWALIYKDFLQAGIPILGPIMFFLMVLILGLAYEFKKGALEWDK